MNYKSYPAYKDSGVEWLGKIPEMWEIKPLKYTCIYLCRGSTPSYVEESDIHVVNQATFSSGFFDFEKARFHNPEDRTYQDSIIKNGDVLLASTGGGVLGKTCYVVNISGVFFADTHVTILRFSNLYTAQLVYYFFSCNYDLLNGILARGSTNQIEVERASLQNLEIALPPLHTQKAIAAFLDARTARIDSLVRDYEELVSLLKEKRQALVSHAVTRGLSELVSPDDPDFGEWAQLVAFKDSGVEWLGEIPEGWEVKRLKYLIEGLDFGVSVNASDISSDEAHFGVLKTSCVYGDVFKPEENKQVWENEESRLACPVKGNTIIVTRMNTPELVGSCGYVDQDYPRLFLPDRMWQVQFIAELLDTKFCWYFIITVNTKSYFALTSTGTSGSMKNLTQGDLLNCNIPLPNLFEQIAIVEYLSRETTKLDTLVAEAEGAIELLKERRSALITAAVTGKINVEGVDVAQP